MHQVGRPSWAGISGPLDEGAQGRVNASAAPVAATPVIVSVAAAVVVAYAAGALVGGHETQ
ncbi:hypothetical protein [Streptomyces abyssomicinicus]|uniref:hypothetical protein n=1 Tax=Streptomyces abyssomicinicus TaxID=574929 RepID=UPI001250BA70|nr:hypothetical protein [Streptomyces abyssomicinicus]